LALRGDLGEAIAGEIDDASSTVLLDLGFGSDRRGKRVCDGERLVDRVRLRGGDRAVDPESARRFAPLRFDQAEPVFGTA